MGRIRRYSEGVILALMVSSMLGCAVGATRESVQGVSRSNVKMPKAWMIAPTDVQVFIEGPLGPEFDPTAGRVVNVRLRQAGEAWLRKQGWTLEVGEKTVQIHDPRWQPWFAQYQTVAANALFVLNQSDEAWAAARDRFHYNIGYAYPFEVFGVRGPLAVMVITGTSHRASTQAVQRSALMAGIVNAETGQLLWLGATQFDAALDFQNPVDATHAVDTLLDKLRVASQ